MDVENLEVAMVSASNLEGKCVCACARRVCGREHPQPRRPLTHRLPPFEQLQNFTPARANANVLSYYTADLCPAVLAHLRVLSVDCRDSSTVHGALLFEVRTFWLTDLRPTVARVLSSS